MEQDTATARDVSENEDMNVRCVEKYNDGNADNEKIISLKNLVSQAEQSLEEAENDLANKKEELKKLQLKLEDEVIKDVSKLKMPVEKADTDKVDAAKKWRVLGMKVRLGVGGMAMTKRRDIGDADTFIVKESEVSIV